MSDDKKQAGKTTSPSVRKDYRIPESSAWAGYWKIFAGLGVAGLAAAAYGWSTNPERFAFSYLFAFFLFLTLGFGSIFFVLVERLTGAHWSVAVRRTAEFFMAGIPVFAVLFIPIIFVMGYLFPWVGEHAEKGEHAAAPAEHAALTIIPEAHAQQPGAPAQPAAGGGGGGTGGGHGDGKGQHVDGSGHGRGDGTGVGHGDGSGAKADDGHGTGLQLGGHHGQGNSVGGGHAQGAAGDDHGAGSGGGHGAGAGGGAHTGQGRIDPHHLEEEKVMNEQKPYLNKTAFLVRAGIYFVLWIWLALRFFGLSTAQDASRDPKLTVAAQRFAPGATLIFGLSLTFAAFDWLMSLNPTWYSTIFGVTIFAGSVVAIFATLIIVTMGLREDGILKDVLKIEHFHDMGKLLFGFMIFWAYVSFSQFMLIWYAALPEETTFYHLRWDGGPWKNISLAIVVLHFVVPFFTILSRNAKRRLPILRIGATFLLVMHCVEMYWIVLPNYNEGNVQLSWMDLACLVGIGGVYLAAVFQRMTKHPLIPIGDPRLSRSLHHEIENA